MVFERPAVAGVSPGTEPSNGLDADACPPCHARSIRGSGTHRHQTFQWSGWFIGSRQLGQRWTILGGVAYLRQLQSNWLPMGGAVWAPNDSTRAELVFPRPRLARRIHSTDRWTTWGYLAGQFGGGAWSVLDSPGQNVLVGYSDLRLVGGVEGFSCKGHEWRAEFGYVFARELRVNSVLLEKPTDALLVQVTFAF